MEIQDTLLSKFINDDKQFHAYVARQQLSSTARQSDFMVIDVNDTYRAFITGNGMVRTADLNNTDKLTELNDMVKGISMRLGQVPTHLHIKSDDLLADYKRILEHASDRGFYKGGKLHDAVIEAAANDYKIIRGSLSMGGHMRQQPQSRTHQQAEAMKLSRDVRALTQGSVQNLSKMEHIRKRNFEVNKGIENNTVIGSLAAGVAGIGMMTAGQGVDGELLHSTGATIATLAGIVGGTKVLSEALQGVHLKLLDKSPFYQQLTENREAVKVREFMEAHNAKSSDDLNRNQANALVSIIAYSSPLISDYDALERGNRHMMNDSDVEVSGRVNEQHPPVSTDYTR